MLAHGPGGRRRLRGRRGAATSSCSLRPLRTAEKALAWAQGALDNPASTNRAAHESETKPNRRRDQRYGRASGRSLHTQRHLLVSKLRRLPDSTGETSLDDLARCIGLRGRQWRRCYTDIAALCEILGTADVAERETGPRRLFLRHCRLAARRTDGGTDDCEAGGLIEAIRRGASGSYTSPRWPSDVGG